MKHELHVKKKNVGILSKNPLNSAHQTVDLANNAKANFEKFHSVYKRLTKENKKILPC